MGIKRMKMRRDRIGKGSIITNINDADDILFEILSRLPAKSLMRFKCVSKRWQSLIQHNPYFIDLHFNRSKTRPRLFLASFIKEETDYTGQYLMSANMFDDKAAVQCTGLNSLGPYYHIQGPINGLVSLFHKNRDAVRIYNLSTREITPWIKRTIKKKDLEVEHGVEVYHDNTDYLFGFDPATKEHKVICVCRIRKIKTSPDGKLITNVVVCEVLTVGHNSWRRIDEVPPFDFAGVSVYSNGSIYWRKVKRNKVDHTLEKPAVLVAFDVGSEKFRMIPVPDFILDQPPKCDDVLFGHCSDLFEVDGCVALLHRMSADTVKLWIFDDDHKKEKIATSDNWIEETISLPFCWDQLWGVSFRAVAGTNQIIVFRDRMHKFVSLHSYDRKNKTFQTAEICGIRDRTLRYCYIIRPFVENLLPVQKQQLHHL